MDAQECRFFKQNCNCCCCIYPEELIYEDHETGDKYYIELINTKSEPGDIIWYNIGYDFKEKFWLFVFACFIIIFTIAICVIGSYFAFVFNNNE